MAQAQAEVASREWTNWSGSLRFTPRWIETPAEETELAALVRRAAAEGRTVRPVGSGHSSTSILETDDILVTLDGFQGIAEHDERGREATVLAGTRLENLGRDLLKLGLSMPTFGDVATQRIAGVIATGTHGTGKTLKNLASVLIGGRLVDAFDPDGHQRPRVKWSSCDITSRASPVWRLRYGAR